MSKNETKEERVELPPQSPKLEKDAVSQWMEWRVAVPRQPRKEELQQLEQSLVRGDISTTFSVVDSANMKVKVRQKPVGNYTELYEACIRALFRLEQVTGKLLSIEGIARPKWETQFVLTQRFGGLQ